MGLLTSASQILSGQQTRLEAAAQNIANSSTPGYKRQISFAELMANPGAMIGGLQSQSKTDFTPGKLIETGNPTDLALTGPGFFVVRTPTGMAYQRAGGFSRNSDGRLVSGSGAVLQAAGGGDLVVPASMFKILADGVVVSKGESISQIAVADFADPGSLVRGEDGSFPATSEEPRPVATPALRQGALEASNVVNGTDMVSIMESLRRAEAGQKLVHTYDDMLGRVISTLGQV